MNNVFIIIPTVFHINFIKLTNSLLKLNRSTPPFKHFLYMDFGGFVENKNTAESISKAGIPLSNSINKEQSYMKI
jgi:hypothetical protein